MGFGFWGIGLWNEGVVLYIDFSVDIEDSEYII